MSNVAIAASVGLELLRLVETAINTGEDISDEQLDEALNEASKARNRWYNPTEDQTTE